MNKKEQNNFLEELKAERDEEEKERKRIRGIFTFLALILLGVGLPLTFCLIGIYCNDGNHMLEGGIAMFCVFSAFFIFGLCCESGFFDED